MKSGLTLLVGQLLSVCYVNAGAHSQTCAETFGEVMSEFKGKHPFHQVYASGGYEIADNLASWVRDVLGVTEQSHPTLFSYYSNINDSLEECLTAETHPYILSGGGNSLCESLEWYSGMHNKTLGQYFSNLLDLGCASRGQGCSSTNSTLDWENRMQLIKNFGYNSYTSFLSAVESECPMRLATSSVYNPNGACQNISELHQSNLYKPQKYYGLSGGGGSGAGFEIFCQDLITNQETTIVTGGGGGGGGVNSPEECIGISSGGGGGGGVQIGSSGEPRVGGGCGNHPPGWIDVKSDVNPVKFSLEMNSTVRQQIQSCHKNQSTVVVLRGGGGGGAGFEAYSPWDVTNCSLSPTEISPNALSVGYGFQFSLGGKLTPNAGNTEDEYIVCPNSPPSQCSSTCLDKPQVASPPDWKGISTVFKCADLLSQRVCKKATTADGRPYGKFAHYTSCNCPISRLYKYTYLPDSPQWEYDRNGTCVYPPDHGEPTPAPGNVFPELSESDLINNPKWCPALKGCPPLPGCVPHE